MNIIEFLKTKIELSETEIEQISKIISRKKFDRKELILPVENSSKKIFFIEDGFCRVFYAKKEKDITLYFLQENQIGLPVDSIFYDQICKFGIEAISKGTVATINYEKWQTLTEQIPNLQKFTNSMMISYVKNATDRIYNLKFQTPKERYEMLQTAFPSIFLHSPLGHIASYLGITQETLSRLRAKR
ncbi:Crp/Fnr family transcriptional regulator [Flavobacterium solisilvae]|uniref:Crp/Fnr family transcriptional regulator n=1 Tax=Flavobacterium solisilvae TaxID=1852019 RepID=A0ABX1QUF2_9FLAO|nr:Crp/Fnr family transcriptional regulator [Flavobacterium solisilvae]NMH25896.1 Crp/Fnr family transcriptional regulator [Flavobacterium solisilvae]